jgi:Domain of unknown function (DUF4157)
MYSARGKIMKTNENQKSTNHSPTAQKPFFGAGTEHAFFSAERAPSTPFFQPKAVSPSALQAKSAISQAEGINQPLVQQMPAFESELNNKEVQRKLFNSPQQSSASPIQAKLTIGEPGDKYEQEADRVASQVVGQINVPASAQSTQGRSVQRQEEKKEELQTKPEITTLQRQEEKPEELQAKSTQQRQEAIAGGEASADLTSTINSARGGGVAIAPNIRQPMEQAFGADFSGVKVHTDGQSDQLNRSIQARAFTTGQDVFFRQGEYNPGSRGGQELLAHELTHVVQQSGGAISSEEKPGKKLINLVENTGHERASPKNGKDGDQPEKLKGDDYANNVQKLLNDLNNLLPGFTNGGIETALSIINSNRAICSVSTSQVTGEDTNTLEYSNLKNDIVQEVTKNQYLIQEADRKHFINQVRDLVSVLIPMIDRLPTTAVDTRVAEVIQSEGKKHTKDAKSAIDDALRKLSEEMKKRLKEYFQSVFEKNFLSKKDNEPKEPPPGSGTGGGILVN